MAEFASLLVALLLVGAPAFAAPLETHPHLQCSACLAIADFVGKKMNESVRLKTTFQASHRLDANNKVKRLDYESSELRAFEILDKICPDVEGNYTLRVLPSGIRVFSANKSLDEADFYGKTDRRDLRLASKNLREMCNTVADIEDELLVSLIKTVRTLDALEEGLCGKDGLRYCGTKKVAKARVEELAKYAKWAEAREKRNKAKRAREELAKRRKAEAEAAAANATANETAAANETGEDGGAAASADGAAVEGESATKDEL